MQDVKNEYWEPLPPDVADWMGLADDRDPDVDKAEPIVIPAQRGFRERLRRRRDS